MTTYNTAIIGPKTVISGFKALGVTPFDAETGEQAAVILKKIKNDLETTSSASVRYASVILIESIAEDIPQDDMERISRGALPAIVILPGLEGSRGTGVNKLKKLAEKAIGSDILG